MRRRNLYTAAALVVLLIGTAVPSLAVHERKEIAGMTVVFGAEPEPAITQGRQELVWRFRGLESEEPVGDLDNLEAVVIHNGAEYGPFRVFGSRREPGTYRMMRIFTAASEYSVRLSFSKAGESESHRVEFDFRIADRSELAIPGKSVSEGPNAPDVVEAFHTALSSGDSDGALAQLAPDVVIFESGGAEMSREEYASHHLPGDLRFASAVERETIDQSHEMSGDTAYVMTRSRTTGSFGERQIDSTGVETMVLRRGADGWKIVHIHWSSRSNQR